MRLGWRTIPLLLILIAAGCSPGERSQSDAIVSKPQPSRPVDITPTRSPQVVDQVPTIDYQDESKMNNQDSQGNADVEFVKAIQAADGTWAFHVTVRHPDTGWEDYADGWDVVTPDGFVVRRSENDAFTRLLLHPHENEQPFTRSQSGLEIPEGIDIVVVRAHDLVDGYGGREVMVDLRLASGEGFSVERG